MPKVTTDMTMMSAPSTKGASFISQGIQDNTVAKTIEAAGGIAKELQVGAGIADVEMTTESAIQDYMDRRDPTKLQAQAAGLEVQVSDLLSGGASEEVVDPVRKQFNNTLTRYQNALKQGVMGGAEFSDRVLDITRQYYNKNPAIAQELLQHSKLVLEASGINTIVKADEEAAKAKQAEQKDLSSYYMELAKKFNVNLPLTQTGSINLPELIKQVNFHQGQSQIIDVANRQNTFTEENFRLFGPQYGQAKFYEAMNLVTQTLNDPSIPYDKQIFSINNMLDSVEQGFTADPRVSRILDKPAVQSVVTNLRNNIAAMKNNITKFASREDAAKYSANMLQLLKDEQYQTVSKSVNPVALEVYSKLVSNAHIANMLQEKPELLTGFYVQAGRVIDGLATDGTLLYTKSKNGTTMAEVMLRDLVQGMDLPKANERDITATTNMLRTMTTDIASMEGADKIGAQDKLVKVLAEGTSKSGLTKLDDEGRNTAMREVNNYVDTLVPEMIANINDYNAKGKEVTLDVLPNGILAVTSNDPQVVQELSKRYIQRINNALKGISNLSYDGNTTTASKDFYQRLGKFFKLEGQ